MREINVSEVEELVRDLCIKANLYLPEDMESCIECNAREEQSPVGKNVFADILDNMRVAREETIPICQDTGMAVIFMTIGQDVHFVGGSLNEAINKGVARGYTEGRLRCSIVSDPLERVNTGDNTPPVVHLKIAEGEKVEIMVAPKGFGSENMSQLIGDINEIAGQITGLSDSNNRIVENISQLSAATEEVTASAEQVREISEQNRNYAEEVKGAIGTIRGRTDEMKQFT